MLERYSSLLSSKNKPKYQKGDVIIWNKLSDFGSIIAQIINVGRTEYRYVFLTPEVIYGKNSSGSYPFKGLEDVTHKKVNPNEIWKKLNEL